MSEQTYLIARVAKGLPSALRPVKGQYTSLAGARAYSFGRQEAARAGRDAAKVPASKPALREARISSGQRWRAAARSVGAP